MPDLTQEQFKAAEANAQARLKNPRAVSAHYDQARNRVIVALTSALLRLVVPSFVFSTAKFNAPLSTSVPAPVFVREVLPPLWFTSSR